MGKASGGRYKPAFEEDECANQEIQRSVFMLRLHGEIILLLYSSYNLKPKNLCLLEGMLSIQHECGSSDAQSVSGLIVLLIIPSSLVLRCEEHVKSGSLKFLIDTLTDA